MIQTRLHNRTSMMPASPPIIIEPEQSADAAVIWLHGLGADANDFLPVLPMLGHNEEHIRFIFPNAPVMPITASGGAQMRAWFDLTATSFGGKLENMTMPDGMKDSISIIHQLIDTQMNAGIHSKRIFLVGFSQGATMALLAGLSYSSPLAGIIAMSGFLPLEEQVINHLAEANKLTPLFVCHGTHDAIVPHTLGEYTHKALKKLGYPSTFQAYPIAHSVNPEMLQHIGQFIDEALA